jgi:hypothetical protein
MTMKAAYKVADRFNVKIMEDRSLPVGGRWIRGRTIWINPKKATPYTILHEIGHVLCGYGCCREHSEYKAHGAAIALARVFEIRLTKRMRDGIDGYAGWTARKACLAIQARKRSVWKRA